MASVAAKSANDIGLADLLQCGLTLPDAHVFFRKFRESLEETGQSAPALWRLVSKELLHPKHPHELHRFVYESIYKEWDEASKGPPPAWFPTQELAQQSNLGIFMEAHGKNFLGSTYHSPIESFPAFQRFSADYPEIYWPPLIDNLSVLFHVPPVSIFSAPDESRPNGTWLQGAVMNAAESCLASKPSIGKLDTKQAIIWRNEGDTLLHTMTYGELRACVNRVANALDLLGFQKGDIFAIDMPMNTNNVIIYLAVVLAGYVVANIADSFSSPEIAMRLRISKAKAMFTQDVILRGGKVLPLYSRVSQAKCPLNIVLPANGESLQVILQNGDISWDKFLDRTNHLSRPCDYQAISHSIEAPISIMFSSGTSGVPKAVPYSDLHAVRLGAEAWTHIDVRVGDVFVWPTNLGWLVGLVAVYGCFLTGGTLGLFNGSPLGREFGQFVQDSGVSIFGTVPSLVKTWRKSNCMDGLDWSKIRLLCSTGEASNADDDLWLSARAFYKPVFEPCGGTELASTFLHGCLLQPQALGTMSTPSMATSCVILDEQKVPYMNDRPCIGEIALMPMLGASNSLLNADNNRIYYEGMPMHQGMRLRRHGDVFERTPGGFYRSQGRIDDTMKLGGIKTSSLEIERVCNEASKHIIETAAVAVPPLGGGPDQLVVFVVLSDNKEEEITAEYLRNIFNKKLQTDLNPYFKVASVIVVPELPRTATNKVLRRVLASQARDAQKPKSRL